MRHFALKTAAVLLLLSISYSGCRKPFTGPTDPCTYSYPDSSINHPKHSAFKAILEKYHKKGLPGMAILIQDEDGVWFGSAGKADIDKGVDFKPCTISKVASITKMMFAATMFQLAEQGKLDLDDKISKWLDADIIKKVKNADKVTIRDLLHHTTGIYDIITDSDFYLAILNNPNKKWSGEELIRFAYNKPAVFEANTDGGYSNTNTLLASMVLDNMKLDGKSHDQWLKELVFNKVGMQSSYYHTYDELPSTTAQGYYDLYNNGTIVNVSNLITGSGHGYGGVYSNVFDLHKFIRALFIDKILVSDQSLTAMQTWISDDEKTDLGIGLLRQYKLLGTHLGIGHSGRDLGYSGDAHYFPTKNNRIFINLVNYGTNGNTKLRQVFYDMKDEFVLKILE